MPASSELFSVLTPSEAWAKLVQHWQPRVRVERVSTEDALRRVLASDIHSPEDLPAFRRSTVDGYAVISKDTHGASPTLPSLLRVVGEAPMGMRVDLALQPGEAVLVHTGSMLPANADAVVMIEHTQEVRTQNTEVRIQSEIEVMRAVAGGDNVLQVGEDARDGALLYSRGQRIRAADIGGLMALGITQIEVALPPRVGIISTGDEVITPAQKPSAGQVRDVNSYALSAQAQTEGATPVRYGIVKDDRSSLEKIARKAASESDIVVLSAGSSVSARDMSVEVIGALGLPGVLVHGVSVKPGKPTIIAVCDGVPVFGLPGNPASAMVVFDLFVAPTIRACLGEKARRAHSVQAQLTRNISSTTGREDFVQVNLEERDGKIFAAPIFGKSNLIYTLVRADGWVKIDLDSNGIRAGEMVDVFL
jgi:molybdopterin molybdotransferase